MRRRPGPGAHGFVTVMKHPVGWMARSLLDGEIHGQEHLPQDGPYIVTANHFSLLDPVLVTLAVGRLVNYMALDELFGKTKVGDEIMYYFGSISMSRDRPPLAALQQALRVLEADGLLGVFPEGGRALHWGERSIKNGAAWLSIATGAPIIPCAITGTEATLSLAAPGIHVPSVRLSLHPPLDPDAYIDRVDPVTAMMKDWQSVLNDELGHWQPDYLQSGYSLSDREQ
ncbi:MAG: lysophospholipid acyltransferase family protein [Actinomycetota bacterium]|nr:lysophospholipid acyltransferase family protein [Actinomycetota bacterium]